MQVQETYLEKFLKVMDFKFIITCMMLVFCLDFFRIIGDLLDTMNMPVPLVYGTVIFLSVIAPLLLIFYYFRNIPPLWGFLTVFIIACPLTVLIDLIFFSTAPFDLLLTPAYLTGIITVSLSLGAITSGMGLYVRNRKLALVLIIAGTIVYFFQYRNFLLDFIRLAGVFI